VAAPAVGLDTDDNRWIFFGTGRFFAKDDAYNTDTMSFYGIKEPFDDSGGDPTDLDAWWTWATVSRNKSTNILDVSNAVVYESRKVTGVTPLVTTQITNYDELLNEMSYLDGWFLNFPDSKERNLGQAVLFGDIVTFTSYIPSPDPCQGEGETYLYATDYRTGTAYYTSVIGVDTLVEDPTASGKYKVKRRESLGKGLSITPNIHTGQEEGSKAFIQTSTGAIMVIQEINPGITKSGKISWREEMGESE
jgi:type IV pilus assembly protein PilY1